jgi:ATP-binding cassette subfamily F protein 3
LALRSEVRKCEDRYNKILEMHEKLQEKLADPALYDDDRVADLEVWSKKFAEVEDGLARAESLWMTALENLETAEGA